MNRWYHIRRMRGAMWLILIGVLALLDQWRILSWDKSWPLFLIVPGVLLLVERSAWTADVRDQQMNQTMPPYPAGSQWAAPPPAPPEKPFIQSRPPEESEREDV